MMRTVRSSSQELWIWYSPSDPPAAAAIVESGLEWTSASGFSHTPHIRCSTISNIAVMSHLRQRVKKQYRVNVGENRQDTEPREDIKRGDVLDPNSNSHHCITSQCAHWWYNRMSWSVYNCKVTFYPGAGCYYKRHLYATLQQQTCVLF